ncbi:hypothetical protein [Haloarcula amylovorans]|uniref:hypothetical protein n=1 Tax=Haloarcula amylovorans TaxID=2562280 RepID=UPI00107699A3|nr:hypothetical protein [Halomicroarcula amylolytica]
MAPRQTALLLAGLLLLNGVSVAAGEVYDGPPTVTVTNEDTTTYRVTAFTADSRQSALLTNFAVTTKDGDRRLAPLSQMVWALEFRNVTLVDDVSTQQFTVEPNETVTTTIESWTPGDVTVYVVEDLGDDELHVKTEIETCPQRQQEHSMTLESGGSSGTSVCASSVDWLLP